MSIIDNFKKLPSQTKTLLAAGGILGLLVALPLFIYAVTNQNFEIRNRAQEACPTAPPCNGTLLTADPIPEESSCQVYVCITSSPIPTPSVSPSPTASPTPTGTPSPSPSASPVACNPSDINKDGITDINDYGLLVADFFKAAPANPGSDINSDGIVDIVDYSIFVSSFFSQTGACE